MLFTVLERACVAFALAAVAAHGVAADREPNRLIDPAFQVPYDKRAVEFERMPLSTLKRCQQTDLPNVTPVFYIYGRTVDDQGRVFYATGGYQFRVSSDKPTVRKYLVGGLGLVFFMDGDRCQEIGPIMDTFTAGGYEETTDAVLSSLASDMAERYEKAFKSSSALKKAFHANRVKRNKHAPELNKAFAPYYVN